MANVTEFEEFFKDAELNENFLENYNEYFVNFLKAIYKNENEKINELISQNDAARKVNTVSTNETLLHIAVRFGSTSLVKNIIKLGTNINAENSDKQTPLYHAIDRSAEMVQILLENGAEVKISDKFEVTPLQRSFLCGSTETVQSLLKETYSIKLDTDQEKSADNFVKCRKIVDICLKLTDNFNWKKYPILLHFVGKYGDEETFIEVFNKSKDININAKNPEKQTLLHVLAAADRLNLMSHVLKNGCYVDEFDGMFRTPLVYAIMAKNPSTVSLPFSFALRYENNEIVTMLLDSGVNINETKESYNRVLFTPFHEAIGYHQPSIFKMTSKKDNKYYSNFESLKLYHEFWHGYSLEMIELLVERGANVKPVNVNELCPFAIACLVGRLDIVKFFLARNVDIPQNALYYAAETNNIDLLETLIEKDCNVNDEVEMDYDVNLGCFLQEAPLSYIVKKKSKQQYVEMIEFLVDNKAYTEIEGIILEAIINLKPEEVVCLLELIPTITIDHTYFPFSGRMYEPKDHMNLHQVTAFFALKKDNIESEINYFNNTFTDTSSNYNYLNSSAGKDSERQSVQDLMSLYNACKSQIEKLKLRKICEDSPMSYFQFLSKDLCTLARRANDEVMQVLNTGEYKKEFPYYTFLLQQRIKRVEKLKSCLEKIGNYYVNDVAKQYFPIDVLDKIYSKWSVGDMRNIGRAFSRKNM